jgi:hypothetical protein
LFKCGAPADEVTLVTDAEEDILELELLCAAAFIPDRPVLVIINPTNVNEASRV